MSKRTRFWLFLASFFLFWACPFIGWIDWHTFWFINLLIVMDSLGVSLAVDRNKN